MSVEAVLDRISESAAGTPAPPVEEQSPEETSATVPPQDDAGKPVEGEAPDETEVDLEAVPETSGDFARYKPLFKDYPELRNILGREKAFSEIAPSFSELRQIVERVPSLDDAEQLFADAENKRILGHTFRGDPASFMESLKESDELAYQQLVTRLPEVLAQTDEKLFSEQARFYSNSVISNVLSIAYQAGDQDLLAAAQRVAQFLGVRPGQQERPARQDNSEAARLRRQLQEREQADQQAAFEAFWGETDSAIINNCVAQIEESLKRAIPHATQAQIDRMKKEAWDKTLETLNAQPQTRAQIDAFRANALKGRMGVSEHKQIVAYGTGRAKLVIPKVVKTVIDDWTGNVLKIENQKTEKKQAIAGRTKDVGAGPQATTSTAQGAPASGKPRSMKDVFRELESGAYVKR